MDDGVDITALAIAARPTTLLAATAAADALRRTLGDHRGDLTLADAAARSGLPLRDAELGLHALLRTQRGHLSVTERGELLFRFPTGLRQRYGRATRALRLLGAGALGLVRWTGRIALTLFVIGYGTVAAIVAALALAVITEDGSPLEALGYGALLFLELLVDTAYWSVHPLRAPDELADGASRQPRAIYQQINGFFLGPPRRDSDPRSAARLLVAEIRFRRGRISLGDVVRVTGLAPEPAGAIVSRLLLDYDGTVEVTDDGAIVYAFTALQPSVDAPVLTGPPEIWRRVRELPTFTGNHVGGDAVIAILTAMIAGAGYLGIWFGLPIWAAQVPFWGSLALLAWLLLRLPAHLSRRRTDRHENGRRALLRLSFDSALRSSGGVPFKKFQDAWRDATGKTIPEAKLQTLLLELGGDLEIDEHGQTAWRFPTLELEMAALDRVRAQVGADEREVGAVELTSLPAQDDDPRALSKP